MLETQNKLKADLSAARARMRKETFSKFDEYDDLIPFAPPLIKYGPPPETVDLSSPPLSPTDEVSPPRERPGLARLVKLKIPGFEKGRQYRVA
jgi:hypothetical protein